MVQVFFRVLLPCTGCDQLDVLVTIEVEETVRGSTFIQRFFQPGKLRILPLSHTVLVQ